MVIKIFDDYIISCGCMKKQYDLIKRSGIVQSRQRKSILQTMGKIFTRKWKKLNEEKMDYKTFVKILNIIYLTHWKCLNLVKDYKKLQENDYQKTLHKM